MPAITAGASGARRTCSRKSSWKLAVAGYAEAESFHSQASWWRSAAPRSGRKATGVSGTGDRGGEQVLEAAQQAQHRGRFEDLAVVFERSGEMVAVFEEEEGEIELGRAAGHLAFLRRREGEAAHLRFGAREVLVAEHHLDQRVAAQAPLRLQLLDQALERQVLVRVGGEGGLADLGDELREARRARQIRAQDQRVDEEADQTLDLAPRAVGDGHADGDVLAPREAAEERREAGEEGHRLRRTAAAGERGESARQLDRQREGRGRAAEGFDRRPRMVETASPDSPECRRAAAANSPAPRRAVRRTAVHAARPRSPRTGWAAPAAATAPPERTRRTASPARGTGCPSTSRPKRCGAGSPAACAPARRRGAGRRGRAVPWRGRTDAALRRPQAAPAPACGDPPPPPPDRPAEPRRTPPARSPGRGRAHRAGTWCAAPRAGGRSRGRRRAGRPARARR